MPCIAFEPTGVDAEWRFSLDGEAPPETFDVGRELRWAVRAPATFNTVKLTTGGALNECPGCVLVSVGCATPEGREIYREGERAVWGHLLHRGGEFTLRLHVSQSIYSALASMLAARTIPAITVWVVDEEPSSGEAVHLREKYNSVEWDDEHSPRLQITWCSFRVNVGLSQAAPDETRGAQGLLPPTKYDLAQMLESARRTSQRIERATRALIWPMWLAAIFLGVLVFR